MPTDACLFFYDCEGCGATLKPKPGVSGISTYETEQAG